MKTERIEIRASKEFKEKLEKLADELGVNKTQVLERAVEMYIEYLSSDKL